MKKLLTLCLSALALILVASCSSSAKQEKNDENVQNEPQKMLVLYYSQTGATKAVAEQIKDLLNADIEEIEVVEPYSGNYNETIERCIKERASETVPEIKPLKADLNEYDVIFLGYPIWFGTYARPIYGLLEAQDFEGKTIVPFCTFGSGGLEASAADLKEALPKAQIAEGYGVRNARIEAIPEEVVYFLRANGYIEGEVEVMPEFGEEHQATEDEAKIFDGACGDYMFDLGKPETASVRTLANGIEYKFNTNQNTTIYVIAAEGEKPVFTKVVR